MIRVHSIFHIIALYVPTKSKCCHVENSFWGILREPLCLEFFSVACSRYMYYTGLFWATVHYNEQTKRKRQVTTSLKESTWHEKLFWLIPGQTTMKYGWALSKLLRQIELASCHSPFKGIYLFKRLVYVHTILSSNSYCY